MIVRLTPCRGVPFFLVGVFLLVACTDAPTAPQGPMPAQLLSLTRGVSGRPARLTTVRDEWRDLAFRNPGFGGMWMSEGGEIVVSATSSDAEGKLRAAAGAWLLAKNRLELVGLPRVVRRVAYDYAQLYDILHRVAATTAQMDGINSFSIDVKVGRVIVGVDDARSTTAAEAAITSMSVPANAYEIRVTGPAENSACTALQSACSPLVAGLQIINPRANTICTIGPIGWRVDSQQPSQPDLSYKVIMTASHCTSSQTSVGVDTIFQQSAQVPLTRAVGYEVDEAPVYGAATCQSWGYPYQQCRYADVAVFRVLDSLAIAGGYTALANSVNPGGNPAFTGMTLYTGSSVVDVIVGEGVRRIGSQLGQKDGVVTDNCVDRRSGFTTIYTLCAQRAAIAVIDGDSGGLMWVPVGFGSGATPRPAGVVFQRDPVSTGVFFSKMTLTLGALGYQYYVSW